ncbi:MAG: mechanosensitive ion channel [Chitinophagales bacterium]|nr:mechanosensitive ion channel [Chitinophagales bacterium]
MSFNPQKYLDQFQGIVEVLIPKVIGAILIWMIGSLLIKWAYRVFKKILDAKEFDPSVETFFLSFIRIGLRIVLFIIIIGVLGIQTTSIAAMLAGFGVAIGSAFNGSLGNFAGGFMIIIYQPIKVGEFIEFNGVSGVVQEIGILNTCILTGDMKTVFLPNGMLSTGIIINWSRNRKIRVDVPFNIEANIDIELAKSIIIEALKEHKLILKSPKPEVYIQQIQSGSIQLIVRPYCSQPDYWTVYNDTHSLVINAFKEKNISQGIPKQILITQTSGKN